MKWKLIIFFCLILSQSFAQVQLKGKVVDEKGQPIFAVNIYKKSQPELGTSSDFDGNFNLQLKESTGILVFSFIGYQTQEISLSPDLSNKTLTIVLKDDSQTLSEVIIKAKDPISEKFSVTKIKKLDIYFNPVAQADGLKAITLMPASTTIDETANPSLRGSSPDRTRVMLNGVPVYTPVRSSQLNNQGFFSLFSTEVIDKEYVYASNPPLTYGNSSAGLVDIQTLKRLDKNQQQLSLSIGAIGFFFSQKIKNNENKFLQFYGNYNNSKAFVKMQQKYLPNLKSFHTKDIGANVHYKVGKRVEINSYNYLVSEDFKVNVHSLNYSGEANAKKKRVFSVNNLNYYTPKGVLSVNTGFSHSNQDLNYGSIESNKKVQQIYTSVNFKSQLSKKLNLQTGISYDYHKNRFNDSIPMYPFAIAPEDPKELSKEEISNHMADIYAYSYYAMSDKLSFSAGLRANIPINHQSQQLNAQIGMKYQIDEKQSIMMSLGNYKSYATPNYYNKQFKLLKSKQFAIDYSIIRKKIGFKSSVYYKQEKGKQAFDYFTSVDKVKTFGLETYLQYLITDQLKFTISNSFINQELKEGNRKFNGKYDFNYLTKVALQYITLKWGSISLSYITHPGSYYTPIKEILTKPGFKYQIPLFSEKINSQQLETYNKIDLGYSRYTPLKNGGAIIPFLSITNIFNINNQSVVYYSKNFSKKLYDSYGKRTIYFGVLWEL